MEIKKTEKEIIVSSDFHEELPSAARGIGGKWNADKGAWIFDLRSEKEVEKLYMDIYGQFGECGDLVTIRYKVTEDIYAGKKSIFICGKQIARAWGRDSGAKTFPGVIFHNCRADSGGSVKNWATQIYKDEDEAWIDIYDIPRQKAESCGDVEILTSTIDKAQLLAEKEKLELKIKEIDKLIDA